MKLKQFFGWFGASALLLTTACTNEEFVEPQGTPNQDLTEVYGNGSKIITLSVGSEAAVATRAGENPHISDGSNVNMLFFEVYDLGTDGSENTNVTEEHVYVPKEPIAVTPTSFPVSIKLAVDPDHKYKIALWAQHTTTQNEDETSTIVTAPFSFKNDHLTAVTVDYSDAKNNDELRDAFCATQFFKGTTTNVDVILHRPFAQLNVGTTGADYKNYMEGNIMPHKKIAYSKMVVKGVYNCIDIANDNIKIDGNFNGEVTFEFEKIPAFMNYSFTGTDFPENYLTSGEIDEYGYAQFDDKHPNTDEFLYVKLNNDPENPNAELKGYKTTYNTMKKTTDGKEEYQTETFKYMSMAYVLVPSVGIDEDNWLQNDPNSYDKYKSSTLSSVEVWFAGINDKKEQEEGHKYFTVNNVPVHRNWRTNLLGGLWGSDDPDDPEDPDNPDPDDDPDDPTSVFYNVKIHVNLCPIYFGEYNGVKDPTKDNGYDGIFSGYFPTEEGKDLHKENNPATEE